MPKVILHERAQKKVAKQPKQDQTKVTKAILQMKISPFESLNVQRYQSSAGKFYRLRIGNIRLVFEFDSKSDSVFIQAIDYRGNIY